MDRREIARQVARAASTGGSKSYRERPSMNWYASIVLIVVLGLLSIIYSRYELTHATKAASTSGKTTYAAFSFDVCGTQLPNLPKAPASAHAILTTNDHGVIHIPPTASKSGKNTLGYFVKSYPGMELTSSVIRYPGKSAYHNGEHCAKGTPDAGKVGVVKVETWSSFKVTTGTSVSGNPSSVTLTNGMEVTMAFLPSHASVPRPSSSTVSQMLTDMSGVKPTSTPTGSIPTGSIPTGGTPTGSVPIKGAPTSIPSIPTGSTPAPALSHSNTPSKSTATPSTAKTSGTTTGTGSAKP